MSTGPDGEPRIDEDIIARYRRDAYVSGARDDLPRADDWTPSGLADEFSVEATAARKPRNRRTLTVVALAIVAIALIGVVSAFAYMGAISGNLHSGVDQDLRDSLVHTDMASEPFYLLLLGTDQSALRDELGELDGIYRSDSIMLARIDPVQKKVALVSIPRDTMVDLGEHGIQKVNAARAFGGPALAVKAVSDLTGVDISHYAEINFDGFQAIVDSLGGIEVEVPIEMDDPDAGGYLAAGRQTLNGEQALILCRARECYAEISAQPDLMRAANQRMVLSAIAHKILAADIATIAKTVGAMSEYVTTDLGLNDIVGLAQIMKGLDSASDIYTATLPVTSEYVYATDKIPEGYYEILDDEAWEKMVGRMNNGLPPKEEAVIDEDTGTVLATAGEAVKADSEHTASVDVLNGTDRDGLAAKAKRLLDDAGFENVSTGQAAGQYAYPETLVVYENANRASEAAEIVAALGQGRAQANGGVYTYNSDFLVIIGDDWKD